MDCSYLDEIRELSAEDFETLLLDSVLRTGNPIGGGIELTAGCNLRCVHCYILPYVRSAELPYSDICHIVDQLVDGGVLYLFLTGGEPLARRDFADIYTYIKRKGMLATVFTNGTLITEELCGVFREYPPQAVEVTVYGATERTYEEITGVNGSYQKCIHGLELLRRNGIPLSLKTVVIKKNHHELALLKDMARQLGARFRYSTMIFPRLDGNNDVLDLRLSPTEVVEYDIGDPVRRKAWRDFLEETEVPSKEEREFLYMCGAALMTFHIDHTGNLCACVRERKHKQNLLRIPFGEAFRQLSIAIRGEVAGKGYRCRNCAFLRVCDQCPAISRQETGNAEEPSPYVCEIGQMRGESLCLDERG